MLYGNSSNGYSYSPNRYNDRVDHYNNRSQFIGANGSRQGGYYASNYSICGSTKKGYYDGRGQWVTE